jgi:hypothetical protein
MNQLTPIALLATLVVTGCTSAPDNSVLVSLHYDDALKLDTAEFILGAHTASAPIAHQMLVLLPEGTSSSFAQTPDLEVWGRKAGQRAAYGAPMTTLLFPGDSIDVTLGACTPACRGDTLVSCVGPDEICPLGCAGSPGSDSLRCNPPTPSNAVDPSLAAGLTGTTTIRGDTTFYVDTGVISGGFTRAAGVDVTTGDTVRYLQVPAGPLGGAPLAVFAFHDLTVDFGTVRFVGSRAVVLLVGDTAQIDGTLDLTAGTDPAGHAAPTTPGPGAGAGGSAASNAHGCGGGTAGQQETEGPDNGGGAGGSGGREGGRGGGNLGGFAGRVCLPDDLEPLLGGSGGGAGSYAGSPAPGGGGGGAIQITALNRLEISSLGTINAGGAGGQGGPAVGTVAGSGGGGGAGGAILLEAPAVTIAGTVAANGGGGGGGGAYRSGVGAIAGSAGHNGDSYAFAASGGFGELDGGSGGDGGAAGLVAHAGGGGTGIINGGGGGGGVGAIVIRGRVVTIDGTITPPAAQLDVKP